MPSDGHLEPDDGEPGALRFRCQLTVVHEDEHYPLPEQGRSLQGEAGKVTFGQLLPRLLGRQRCQSGRQVSTLAV